MKLRSFAQRATRLLLFSILLFYSFSSWADIDGSVTKYTVAAIDDANGLSKMIKGQKGSVSLEEYPAERYGQSGCASTYMFTDYVGSTVRLEATYYTGDHLGLWEDGTHIMTVYKDGVHYFPASYPYSPFIDGMSLTFTEPGKYTVVIDEVNVPMEIYDDFEFYFIIVPKINSVSIEADPLCYAWAPADSLYHFNIRTTPDISSVMATWPQAIVPTGGGGCDFRDVVNIKFLVEALSDGTTQMIGTANFGHFNSVLSSVWPTGYSDLHGFTFPYYSEWDASLKDYLFFDGAFGYMYGSPLDIKVRMYDHIGYKEYEAETAETPLTATVPLVIKGVPTIDVDINTRCAPGYSTPAVLPQYTASVLGGGVAPFNFYWSPVSSNNVTLSDQYISNPKVTGVINAANPLTGNFMLTVTDAAGCLYQRPINTQYITAGYDLASRDTHTDLYNEPYIPTLYMDDANIWDSKDIWNRYSADGVAANQPPLYVPDYPSNPAYGKPNYLYTKVRNVGCIASPAYVAGHGAPYLSTYWTIGGFGGAEEWPNAWTINTLPGSGMLTANQGLWIANTNIPVVNPGESVILNSMWTPPNPQNYLHSPTSLSLCFLARIVDYHNMPADPTFGMTTQEETGVDPNNNVMNNNNIVTKNTSVMYADQMPRRNHFILLGNIGRTTRSFSVEMSNSGVLNPGLHLDKFVYAKVCLGDMFDKWVAAGAKGTYKVFDEKERSITFDCANRVCLDSVVIDSGMVYPINIATYMIEGADMKQIPDETIHFRQLLDDGKTVTGNYSFSFAYSDAAPAKGALMVTEISKGPSDHSAALSLHSKSCQYAEMIVANCGNDASEYVDVEGWILDDNSGNFNIDNSCSPENGASPGHYRLAGEVWRNVPVGSRIVVYNAAASCYSLPSVFTYDEAEHIYWVPVTLEPSETGTVATEIIAVHEPGIHPPLPRMTRVIEQYTDEENPCAYCNGSESVYTPGYNWDGVINLAMEKDAFQVRCPGCSSGFYGGVAYCAPGDSSIIPVPSDSTNLGGVVCTDSIGGHAKYVYIGTDAAGFTDAGKWAILPADEDDIAPPSLGYVNEGLYQAVRTHSLGFNCCTSTAGLPAERRSKNTGANAVNNNALRVNVYPNPADFNINFNLSVAQKGTVEITDITGRVVVSQSLSGAAVTTVNVSNVAPGLYLYNLVTGSQSFSGKIIITK